MAARTADVAVCNTSLHRTFLPSVLDFKTIPNHFNFGEVAWEGGSLSWQRITVKGKSGASMDAVLTSPRVTKLDCKSTIPICPGTVFTVKTVLSGILGRKGVAGYHNIPDIRMFFPICISVYPAPSWTDLTQFVTSYPVLFSLLHFKLHNYPVARVVSKDRTSIFKSLHRHTILYSLHRITHTFWCRRDSVVRIATSYELFGLGIESLWGPDFPHPPRPGLGSTHPRIQGVPGLFPWNKAAEFWR